MITDFILDPAKANIGSLVIPVGSDPTVTVFADFEVSPLIGESAAFGIYDNGEILVGNNTMGNNILLNGGIDFNFKQITDTSLSNYNLTFNDYAVEIITDTIDTITLPLAMGIGGRTYIVSRGSNNNALAVVSQAGDNIDTRQFIKLNRIYTHMKLMSNGQDSWYVV
jgi:hypothetical protein